MRKVIKRIVIWKTTHQILQTVMRLLDKPYQLGSGFLIVRLASFPGPKKERRGPGTHCSRMCGLHGNQVAGVIDEAQTELVYL